MFSDMGRQGWARSRVKPGIICGGPCDIRHSIFVPRLGDGIAASAETHMEVWQPLDSIVASLPLALLASPPLLTRGTLTCSGPATRQNLVFNQLFRGVGLPPGAVLLDSAFIDVYKDAGERPSTESHGPCRA